MDRNRCPKWLGFRIDSVAALAADDIEGGAVAVDGLIERDIVLERIGSFRPRRCHRSMPMHVLGVCTALSLLAKCPRKIEDKPPISRRQATIDVDNLKDIVANFLLDRCMFCR